MVVAASPLSVRVLVMVVVVVRMSPGRQGHDGFRADAACMRYMRYSPNGAVRLHARRPRESCERGSIA